MFRAFAYNRLADIGQHKGKSIRPCHNVSFDDADKSVSNQTRLKRLERAFSGAGFHAPENVCHDAHAETLRYQVAG